MLQEENNQQEALIEYHKHMCAEAESKVNSLELVRESLVEWMEWHKKIAVVLNRLLQRNLAFTNWLFNLWRLKWTECRMWRLKWKECHEARVKLGFWPFDLDVDSYTTQVLEGVMKKLEMEPKSTIPHNDVVPITIDQSGSPPKKQLLPVAIAAKDIQGSPPKKRLRPELSAVQYRWLDVKPQERVSTSDVRVPCMSIASVISPLLSHPLQVTSPSEAFYEFPQVFLLLEVP